MMLLTEDEAREKLRQAVRKAGGALRFLQHNKIYGREPVRHMFDNGTAVLSLDVLGVLGLRKVERYEEIDTRVLPGKTE